MAGRAATDGVIKGRCAISVNDPGHPTPSGWKRVALSEIADLGTGHTPSRKHPEYWDGDIAWIGIRDAGTHHGGVINDTTQHITELGLANSAARLLPKDTICLSRTASVGYVVKMGRDMATSQDFVTWTCSRAIDPDFLKKALLAEGDDIRQFGEGSTHTTIYFPEVKAFHIDLPPIEEQRRITARIDSLAEKSIRARNHLSQVERLVEKYKEGILRAAFRGDLTESKFRRSRAARKNIGAMDFDIPECWDASTGEQVCEWITKGTTPQKVDLTVTGGVPFIKVYNLTFDGTLDFSVNPTFVKSECHNGALKRSKVYPGDVLINIVGPPLGKMSIVSKDFPEWNVNQAIAIFRPRECIDNMFLAAWLASPMFLKWATSLSKATAGQSNLTLEVCRNTPIPLPSKAEQIEIARSIRMAFSWIERLATESGNAQKLIQRLDQAVLSKAFRGELVPQDPNDEPASVLLERIKGEKDGAAQPRGGRGRPPSIARV